MADKGEIFWNHENADHRRAFATALAPLVSVLWKRKDDFGIVEARTYMRTLKHVPSHILVEAVEKSLMADKWFPEPAVLLGYAADIIAEKRKAACQRWLTDCEDCHGSRWSEITVDGVTRNERCGCWRRAMAVLAEIGQPIERPRLMAGSEAE